MQRHWDKLPASDVTYQFGPYQVVERLGVGGMAEVWLARRTGPEAFVKDYVVKRILPHLSAEPKFVSMFLNEARLAARLSHASIAQVFELGEEAGQYYIVMEYVDGRSLRDLMRFFRDRGQEMPLGVALYIGARAAEGLHHAHEKGLVHRDVSPENILVSFDGQVKVVDFGIARAIAIADKVAVTTNSGKLPYMSPEQATGREIDRRADVYALGVTLYEMLAGERPFVGDNPHALLWSILEGTVRPLERPGVWPLVAKTLERDVEARTADARMLALELDSLLRNHAPTTAADLAAIMERSFERRHADPPKPTVPEATVELASPLRPKTKRRWPLPAAIATIVLAAAAYGTARRDGAAPVVASPRAEPLQTATMQAPRPTTIADSAPRRAVTDAPSRVPERQPAHGKIEVRVRPWGDVIVDDQALGITPVKPLDVAAGRHRVVAVNANLGKRKVVTVEVRPGKSTIVEIDLVE